MATLFITIFGDASQTLIGEPTQEMTVTVAGTSTQSSEITAGNNPAWRRVRLFTDTDCFVTWGIDPTAINDGSGGLPLGAENPESFTINSGQKIAVIART